MKCFDIPPDKLNIWESMAMETADEQVRRFQSVSKYGVLMFGGFNDGHVGWRWAETGGGGPITIPYSISPAGRLYIALRNELRENLGGWRWCVIGGFKEPSESNESAQAREATEEAGMDTSQAFPCDGLPFVSNRNYFIADAYEDEGIHPFAIEIPFDQLVEGKGDTYELKGLSDYFDDAEHVRFFFWKDAILKSPDGIARAGIATLMAQLLIENPLLKEL